MLGGLKWIGLIVATMIGAGYASGREIWEFFGHESGLAILLFMMMFIISCIVVLTISYELKTEHYLPVLQTLVGKKFANFYDWGVLLYLFTMLFVMISGSGATVHILELPYFLGVILMIVLLLAVIPYGMDGIVSINRFLLPMLIIGLAVVLIIFIYRENVPYIYNLYEQSNWASAIPFTSLNVVPLVAVIGAIGKEIKTKKEIYVASIGSGLILGVISYLYNISLIHVSDQLFFYEIPLFAILNGYPIQMFFFMSVLLWFAIYTTAITSLFGLIARVKEYFKWSKGVVGVLIICAAVPFTLVGFSNLISYLYPLYGLINIYVLAMILLFPIIRRANQGKI
ncbi:YkvI family membrane protein [Piscibacillus halophilus]|uniref:Uncharacterized membrane protein YkvI n=2 Tax=Piscibacillus halophilus TaxID=571933 RepID=A0A1H9D258_9BACI|nr:hypothetical protein [Piscibacillus halophilus]SEQ06913.1 Uncharacterized membrane protein YkvI [Piscibacillus halophilus]